MHITILGAGYEGIAISVGLAMFGHTVSTVDADPARARHLQRGVLKLDIDDEELSSHMKSVLREGQLRFTSGLEKCLAEAEVVVISEVPNPDSDTIPDKEALLRAAECLTGIMGSFSIVVVSARVPSGSCHILQDWLNETIYSDMINVVAFPAFPSRDRNLHGFLHPERIILGYKGDQPRRILDELFANPLANETPICHVSWETAEMMSIEVSMLSPSISEYPKVVHKLSTGKASTPWGVTTALSHNFLSTDEENMRKLLRKIQNVS